VRRCPRSWCPNDTEPSARDREIIQFADSASFLVTLLFETSEPVPELGVL